METAAEWVDLREGFVVSCVILKVMPIKARLRCRELVTASGPERSR